MKLKFCFYFESQFEFERYSIKLIQNKNAVQTIQKQSNGFFFDNRKMVRARDDECVEFRIMHQIKFQSLIRGHHVYKILWSPCKGET